MPHNVRGGKKMRYWIDWDKTMTAIRDLREEYRRAHPASDNDTTCDIFARQEAENVFYAVITRVAELLRDNDAAMTTYKGGL